MIKNLKYILLISLLAYCNKKGTKYHNHEKWQWTSNVMGWWFYERVHGKPVQVKEFFLDSIHYDSNDHHQELPAYTIRKFDKTGNIIFLEEVYADSTHFISEVRFDQNGKQMKGYVVNKSIRWGVNENDTTTLTSSLMDNGKYKVEFYDASGIQPNPRYSLISFSDNTKVITEEELFPKLFKDTSANVVSIKGFANDLYVVSTNIKEYNDAGNIKKYVSKNNYGSGDTYLYYYDKNGFLDSIVQDSEGKKSLFEFCINNNHGDPGTIGSSTFKYEYDKYGNWIKRVANFINGPVTVRREITYAQ